MWLVYLVPVWLMVLVHDTLGFPKGAPEDACERLTPGHGAPSQSTDPPMQLVLGKAEARPGELVRLRLESSTNDYVKGFIIQARDVERRDRKVGTFTFERETNATIKHLDCFPGIQNTITHASNTPKFETEAFWVVPTDFEGDVMFRYSLVKDFNTYWVGIDSQRLSVIRRNTLQPSNANGLAEAWQGIQDLFDNDATVPIVQGIRSSGGSRPVNRPPRPFTIGPNPATQVSISTVSTTPRPLQFVQSQFFVRSTLPPLGCSSYGNCSTSSDNLTTPSESSVGLNGLTGLTGPTESLADIPVESTGSQNFPGPPLMSNEESNLGETPDPPQSGNASQESAIATETGDDEAIIIQVLRQQQLDREIREQQRLQQQLQEQIRQLQQMRQQALMQQEFTTSAQSSQQFLGERPIVTEQDVIQIDDEESVPFEGVRPNFGGNQALSSGISADTFQPDVDPIVQDDGVLPSLGPSPQLPPTPIRLSETQVSNLGSNNGGIGPIQSLPIRQSEVQSFGSNSGTRPIQMFDNPQTLFDQDGRPNFNNDSPQTVRQTTSRPLGTLPIPIQQIPAVQPIIQGSGLQPISSIPSMGQLELIRDFNRGSVRPTLQPPRRTRPTRQIQNNLRSTTTARPSPPRPTRRRMRPRRTTQRPFNSPGNLNIDLGVPELNENDEDRLLMQLLLTSGGIRNILLAALENQSGLAGGLPFNSLIRRQGRNRSSRD